MKKILVNIIPPLSLFLAKRKKVNEIKYEMDLKLCKGSQFLCSNEMAVINHHKPIIKIEL